MSSIVAMAAEGRSGFEYLLFGYLVKLPDALRGIEADRLGQRHELHDIDAPLSGFDVRDVGLVPLELLGDLNLRQVGGVPLRNDVRHQRFVACRAKRTGHLASESGGVLAIPKNRIPKNMVLIFNVKSVLRRAMLGASSGANTFG
jgi:hypothetical protein